MRRRLGFATAVVHRPALVVLDEPTAGLDPEQRAALGAVVAALATDRVVLASTHVLDDLRRYAGDVAVMAGGRIAHHGPVAGMVAAAAASLGEPLDPARGEDLERAYLAIQARAAACSG
jgi:ABC-2 type transport system ATP-binding protein